MTAGRRDLGAAAGSGLLLALAFPPLRLGALAWIGFVPLLLALERRVASGARARSLYALGYASGFLFFLIGTHWIARLSDVASTVPWLKYLGWLLAAGYLANFWALATLLAGTLARRSGVPPRWTFAAAMLAVEEARGSGELGFPWFQPGYTQHALPSIGMAALGGVSLVTLWVLLVNGAFAAALKRGAWRARAAAVVLLLAGLTSRSALEPERRTSSPTGPMVGLVQGDIPGEIKWSGRHQEEILSTFLALSDSATRDTAADARVRILIWPETATGSYLRKQLGQSLRLAEWCARRHVPVFTGYADYDYDAADHVKAWNAAGTWHPDGSLSARYAKRHLVPFGERMPFEWLVPALGKVDLGQAEWTPGTGTVLFPGPAGPFSCLICFESIFPDLARRDVRAGARMLVNVTNDEWFGNSAALYQHAAMAPFRAVENGVPLLRCANTGLTEILAPSGRVTASLPVFTPAVLRARIPPANEGSTLFTRVGDWPGAAALFAVLALLIAPPSRRAGASDAPAR